jgi:hypothetical protein
MGATPCQDCSVVPADCIVYPAEEMGSRVVCLSCRRLYVDDDEVDDDELAEDDLDQLLEGQTAFALDEGLIE